MSELRRIVAMGGGGFTMEPDNPLLDDFLLELTGKERPKVAFLPTALGDSPLAISRFHAAFEERGVERRQVTLFGRPRTDLRELMLSQDLIYVSGGNTANALAVWRVHGMDAILRECWEAGVLLAGLSAGMICWYECSVTDSFGPLAALEDGLGFLPGSACPHYDGEAERRPAYTKLVAEGFPEGVAADDGVGLVYSGSELVDCVSSRPEARAFRLERRDGAAAEEPLAVRFLG
jgi:peptidase E